MPFVANCFVSHEAMGGAGGEGERIDDAIVTAPCGGVASPFVSLSLVPRAVSIVHCPVSIILCPLSGLLGFYESCANVNEMQIRNEKAPTLHLPFAYGHATSKLCVFMRVCVCVCVSPVRTCRKAKEFSAFCAPFSKCQMPHATSSSPQPAHATQAACHMPHATRHLFRYSPSLSHVSLTVTVTVAVTIGSSPDSAPIRQLIDSIADSFYTHSHSFASISVDASLLLKGFSLGAKALPTFRQTASKTKFVSTLNPF